MQKARAPGRVLAAIASLPFWVMLMVFLKPLYVGEPVELDLTLPLVIVSTVVLSGVTVVGTVPFK